VTVADAPRVPTLDDRIAAHPVAVAVQAYVAFWLSHQAAPSHVTNPVALSMWDESLERTKVALTAALDADDQARAEAEDSRQQLARILDYDGDEMSTLGGAVSMAGTLYRTAVRERDRSAGEADTAEQERDAARQRAETLRLEVEALQAAARLHREEAGRFRAAVEQAVADLVTAGMELKRKWVDKALGDLRRTLDERPAPAPSRDVPLPSRDEAITRLRELSRCTGLDSTWKPWELSYAVGTAAYHGGDLDEIHRLAVVLGVTGDDLYGQPFGAAPGGEG
jgi:hypothetical protein